MKDNNKDVPLIVNGELNIGRKKVKKEKEVILPTKRFKFIDVVLSFIGVILIIYGVYTIINKDTKQEPIVSSNTQVEVKTEKKVDYEKLISLSAEEINLYDNNDYMSMNSGINASSLSNNAKLSLAAKLSMQSSVDGKKFILDSELDSNIKYLFGDINYTKEKFSYGNFVYTYNQETKRYYLMSEEKRNLTYEKYDFIEKNENDGVLIINDYVAYTFPSQNRTISINKRPVEEIITSDNIKDKYSMLEHFEYKFIKKDDRYILESVTIK